MVNGSAADTVALVTGGTGTVGSGIFVNSSTVSVSNFGTVNGAGTGIDFFTNGTGASAGTVVNGSTADTSALIVGSFNGIFAGNSITVSNFANHQGDELHRCLPRAGRQRDQWQRR